MLSKFLLVVFEQQILLQKFCQPATHYSNQRKIKSICEAEDLVFAEHGSLFTKKFTEHDG